MILAKIRVTGTHAQPVYVKPIPMGIIGGTVRFEYTDPMWDGLNKTVVFQGAVTKDVVSDGSTVTIPSECVTQTGKSLRVGVYGTDADGKVAIPTLWADLGRIKAAADPSGDPAADPTLPIWAQLQGEIEDLRENGVAVDMESIEKSIQEYLKENPPAQFETDETLILEDGILRVNTADVVEEDNTLPVTSAAVQTVVGNIGAILDTI